MIRFNFQNLEHDTYTLELTYGQNHDAGVTGRFTLPFTSNLCTILPTSSNPTSTYPPSRPKPKPSSNHSVT